MDDKRKQLFKLIRLIRFLKLNYIICNIACIALVVFDFVLIYKQLNKSLCILLLFIVLFLLIYGIVSFCLLSHYNKKFGRLNTIILLEPSITNRSNKNRMVFTILFLLLLNW